MMTVDINPKGLVPALEYKNRALYESLIICEFIEDAYPDHTPHLLPKDPFDRAHARLWVDHVSKAIVPAVCLSCYPTASLADLVSKVLPTSPSPRIRQTKRSQERDLQSHEHFEQERQRAVVHG